jgi:hypothetical protein
MSLSLRALLWAAVLVAPGGVVALPLLAADAVRRRRARARLTGSFRLPGHADRRLTQ